MKFRRGLAAVPLTVCFAVVAGCADGVEPVSPTELDLSGSVAAFTLSPQAPDLVYSEEVALLGVIREDGTVDFAQMRPMDAGELWWSDEVGLFVSDDSHDYVLGSDGVAIPSEKSDFQNGVMQVPGSRAMVAVYNRGFTEGGYSDDLVITRGGTSEKSTLDGDYEVMAGCAGQGVYGIGHWFGEDQPEWRIGMVQFKRLDRAGGETWVDLGPDARINGRRAACAGGVIHALVAVPDAASEQATDETSREVRDRLFILSFDVKSKKHELKPLEMDGREVRTSDVSAYARGGWTELLLTDGQAIAADGKYEWYADTGIVYATDPATGVTIERADTGWVTEPTDRSKVQFTADTWTLLTHDTGSKELTLVQFDRRDGRKLRELEVSKWREGIDDTDADAGTLVLRGFALNPEQFAAENP